MFAMLVSLLVNASVTEVTHRRAYLDVGLDDGARLSQELTMTRLGAPVGTCVIDAISAHRSSCVGTVDQLRVGDQVSLLESPPRVEPISPLRPAPTRPASTSLGEVAFPRVEFRPAARDETVDSLARAELRGTLSLPLASAIGGQGSGSAALVLRRLPLGFLGLEFSADLLAFSGSTHPEAARFRQGAAALYVYEAAFSAHPAGWTIDLGRVRPGMGPVFALDGALVSRSVGSAIIGGFVGFLPDSSALEPKDAGGGLFARLEDRNGDTFLRGEATALAVSSEPGPIGSLELLADASQEDWRAWFVGRGALDDRGAALENLTLGGRMTLNRVSLGLEARHRAEDARAEVAERSTATGEISMEISDRVRLSLDAGLVNPTSDRVFGLFGPRIDWGLEERTWVVVGYEESLSAGRSGYAGLSFVPGPYSLFARLAVSDEVDEGGHLGSASGIASVRARWGSFFGAATIVASQPFLLERAPSLLGRLSLGIDSDFER
ncbi:MAG: hypothetical protein HY791_14145 [Deltaproteobacteria bacterium]|nr:hypothetical protein [Deltaproteobacteria bacterium]